MKNYSFLILIILFSFWACTEGDIEPSGSDGYLTFSGRGLQGLQDNPQVAGADRYNEYVENPFIEVSENPVSTFSVDADGASYANLRRFILQDQRIPPKGAVRTEELINYFDLKYPFDNYGHPIALNGEVSNCPWQDGHKLIRIGIQGKEITKAKLPPSNFVFLIDVSGSMSSGDKLELLKQGFKLFVNELSREDKVAIVTYAGSAGVVLPATSGNDKAKIRNAIDQLGAGGSTAGAQGIKTAYEIASANFIVGGNNRVILGTDGDFNVGISSQEELVNLIEEKRESGIFLSVLGVGRGNLNDGALEQIANNGNGTYEYIDNLEQLKKVFIYDYAKFYTVAKDVKVQVKFNPVNVESYRLIGYENRILEEEDFEDDEKDAGEIGAGQNITALYEIIPKSNPKFRAVPTFTIDFRYKNPDEDVSKPLRLDIFDKGNAFQQSSDYMKFTASVAAFGMVLIDSEYKGNCDLDKVLDWSKNVTLDDPNNFKSEFKTIVKASKRLK